MRSPNLSWRSDPGPSGWVRRALTSANATEPYQTLLPHDDPDASQAFYRDTLGFEVRGDVEYGAMHWITVGPPDQPGRSIVLYPPAATPGITEDERRTIAEMMAKRTYASITWPTPTSTAPSSGCRPATPRSSGADRAAVRRPRLRPPRSRGQPDPHPGAALTRPAIAPTFKRLGSFDARRYFAMAERKPAKKRTQKSAKRTTAINRKSRDSQTRNELR